MFVIGNSEDTEAEYGFRSESAATMLSMFNDEVYCVEGFATVEAARANLKAEGVAAANIIRL